jgi:hypothetical protein
LRLYTKRKIRVFSSLHNTEFGHKGSENSKKNPQATCFHLVFTPSLILPERLHCCYYYNAIIILEPCALNAEFQHFIFRCNENFLTLFHLIFTPSSILPERLHCCYYNAINNSRTLCIKCWVSTFHLQM